MDTQNLSPAARKRVIRIMAAAMFFATVIYLALTYMAQLSGGPPPANTSTLVNVLTGLALLGAIASVVADNILLAQAKTAEKVQTALVTASALSESCAVFGLLAFFVTHQRAWPPFVLSWFCFARLFLRLPEYDRRIDALS